MRCKCSSGNDRQKKRIVHLHCRINPCRRVFSQSSTCLVSATTNEASQAASAAGGLGSEHGDTAAASQGAYASRHALLIPYIPQCTFAVARRLTQERCFSFIYGPTTLVVELLSRAPSSTDHALCLRQYSYSGLIGRVLHRAGFSSHAVVVVDGTWCVFL